MNVRIPISPRPPSARSYRLATRFRLDVSLFERLVKNRVEHVTLARQRRMRPQIARLIAPIYPHLHDHPHVETFPDVRGVARNLFFVDHAHPEGAEAGSASKSNRFEAEFAAALVRYLVRRPNGYVTPPPHRYKYQPPPNLPRARARRAQLFLGPCS